MKALMILLVLMSSSTASAFHTDETFGDDASVGGGGGIYYTGSPRFKRYTCAACHLDAPGDAFLAIAAEPSDLFSGYTPGQTYQVTVALQNETRGLDARSNYNTFALETLDADDVPKGKFFGFDFNLLRTTSAGDILFARGQNNVTMTSWTFQWQAPESGTGYVDWYVAAVDGDGASDSAIASSDPIGDDVVATALRIAERGTPAPPLAPPEAPIRAIGRNCSTAGAPGSLGVLWITLLLWRIRR